jgi:biopolymer transport protein ExbB
MQRVLALLLFCLSLSALGTARADTPWWQAEWKYRKSITLDAGPGGAALGGNLGRTPVLVRLHTGNFAFDGVAEGGKDIRFVGADGHTVLNHQIEQYDAGLGMALIWVDVPSLSGTAPQTVWMYYGNGNAPATSNGQRVFDPDYSAVLHFADSGNEARDTTAYANPASGAFTAADGAIIGRGARLSGTPLQLPGSPSLAIAAGGAMTFSAWVKPAQLGPDQALYARREGGNVMIVGLDNGVPYVRVNDQRSTAVPALVAGQWAHVAVTSSEGKVVLWIGGREASRIDASLPAFAAEALIGADSAPAAGDASEIAVAQPFLGDIDEVRVSKVARPATLLLADATAQGAESRLLTFGEDEQSAGVSHFGFILKAMPVDAWVVVVVLGLMMLMSWAIMIAKSRYFGTVARANLAFSDQYRKVAGAPVAALQQVERSGVLAPQVRDNSTLWKLYRIAMEEMDGRGSHHHGLTAAAITSIRASMDAEVTRESERMSKRMNWLSTTIEGAPYVGLFGTVIGIMLVFVVAAMAGAVDINSVAPGMAAALLCTAAGLGVAIPALFGYNWLASRAEAIAADMSVFVDEFTARLAEEFDRSAPAAVARPALA